MSLIKMKHLAYTYQGSFHNNPPICCSDYAETNKTDQFINSSLSPENIYIYIQYMHSSSNGNNNNMC